MKIFVLKTQLGETIAKINANDLDEAQVLFSKIKVLSLSQLLKLFNVEEIICY